MEHLPPDSALARAVSGHAWTNTNYQLANLHDMLEAVRRQVAASAGAKNLGAFKPVQRPENKPRDVPDVKPDAFALLQSLKPPKLPLPDDQQNVVLPRVEDVPQG